VPDTYSTYEAKSRFSEIIRRVREGRRVVISYHGEPVAEITPIARPHRGLGETLASLERDGVIAGGHRRPAEAMASWRAVARKPGALKRFLKSRDE
jgi:prevent-host-death family protein